MSSLSFLLSLPPLSSLLSQDGFWVGVRNDSTPYFANTIPGFLDCSRLGTLPGCIFKYDNPDEQCAAGRQGEGDTFSLL